MERKIIVKALNNLVQSKGKSTSVERRQLFRTIQQTDRSISKPLIPTKYHNSSFSVQKFRHPKNSLRNFSTSAEATSPATKASVERIAHLLEQGQLIVAERLVKEVLKAESSPQALQQAISIADLIGSVQEQNQLLETTSKSIASLSLDITPADAAHCANLISYLSNRASILSAAGLHNMAIKRLETALIIARALKDGKLIDDTTQQLGQVHASADKAGNVDKLCESPNEMAAFEHTLTNTDLVQLIQLSAMHFSTGFFTEGFRQMLVVLDIIQANWKAAAGRLGLQTEAEVKEKFTSLFVRLLQTLLFMDDVPTIQEIVNRYHAYANSSDPQLQKAMQRLERIQSIGSTMSETERLFHRESHHDAWKRLVEFSNQMKDLESQGQSIGAIRDQIKKTLMELVVRQDPQSAVFYVMWCVLPQLQNLPLHIQIAELDGLMARLKSGQLNLPLRDDMSPERVYQQIADEKEYVLQQQIIRQYFINLNNSTVENQLDAINAANKAIALVGPPAVVDGTMLHSRSMIYASTGLISKAINDLSLARSLYMPHAEYHLELAHLIRRVEGNDSKNWIGNAIRARAAVVRRWDLQKLSDGFFFSSRVPQDHEVFKLSSDAQKIDKISSVGANVVPYSASQLWNGQGYLIYKYSSFPGLRDVEEALKLLDNHFESTKDASQRSKDLARAQLLFNKALMTSRDKNLHSKAAELVEQASLLYDAHSEPIPAAFNRLKEEASSAPVLHADHPWFPLL